MSRYRHMGHGLAAAAALALGVDSAHAEDLAPFYTVLSPGVGGPEWTDGGPGNEQADVVAVQRGEDVYLVSVYMNSDTFGPYWQCKCSSVRLSPAEQPEVVASNVDMTDFYFVGDRPCNHPRLATDGDNIVWVYGSDVLSTNVQTYANLINEQCQTFDQLPGTRISANYNNNEGAPDVVYSGNGTFTAGYLSTGGEDISYARGLQVTGSGTSASLQKGYLTGVVTPANIGRPTITGAPGTNRALFCAAKGNNRPPEYGVECAWLDATSGDVLWKQYIAESDPLNHVYMNQPAVAWLGENRFAVQVVESDGGLKKKENKGASTQHLYVVEATDTGMQTKTLESGIGAYQVHSTICAGRYGLEGARHVSVFDASVTGSGQPGMQMVSYDTTTTALGIDAGMDNWVVSPWGDSGHLQNLYGRNPNTQGRGFMRCIGDVPNPSFGIDGGFRPQVKSFFVAPHDGRKTGEPKNQMVLSLVPGEVTVKEAPAPPSDDPGGGDSETPGGTSDPGTGETPPGEEGKPASSGPLFGPGTASACALVDAGLPSGSRAWLVALGLVALGRRGSGSRSGSRREV